MRTVRFNPKDAHYKLPTTGHGITQGSSQVGFTYDGASRRSTLTLPNGVVATYGYDIANQLTSQLCQLWHDSVMLPDTRAPIESITIPTTSAQDAAIKDFRNNRTRNPGTYDLAERDCTTTARDALAAAGINTPDTIFPRIMMHNLQRQFGGI